MHLLFGEIPLFLNFTPKYTWAEIAKNMSRLDDAYLASILFEHPSGLHVLPAPNFFNSADIVTPQVFLQILGHLRGLYDHIIIDAGHSLSDIIAKTLEASTRVFLISLLSLPCLSNTGKLLRSFEAWGYPRRDSTDVLINRYVKTEISLQDGEKGINKKIFWKIPNDYESATRAVNQGTPLCDSAPKAAVTRSFSGLAGMLAPGNEAGRKSERVFFKKLRILKPMFKGA
jgi:pilus assembly protein CpaE